MSPAPGANGHVTAPPGERPLPGPGATAFVPAVPGEWPLPQPRHRLLATSILGGSFNPEGVEANVRLGAQMLLYRSKDPAFRDNFVFVGMHPRINPTASRIGPTIEIQPLSVFNLKMNLELLHYFGGFGALQSFASPLAEFGVATRDRNVERGKNYSTVGARLSITPFF